MKKIYVIGLGPGSYEDLTLKADRALQEVDVIIGYTVYVDLVKEYYPGKEFLTTPMKKEVERCKMAFEEAEKGKKVLSIDLDPQGNSTSGYGIEKSEVETTIYEVLLNNDSIRDAIIKTEFDNIDIVAAATELAGAEIEFTDIPERE